MKEDLFVDAIKVRFLGHAQFERIILFLKVFVVYSLHARDFEVLSALSHNKSPLLRVTGEVDVGRVVSDAGDDVSFVNVFDGACKRLV